MDTHHPPNFLIEFGRVTRDIFFNIGGATAPLCPPVGEFFIFFPCAGICLDPLSGPKLQRSPCSFLSLKMDEHKKTSNRYLPFLCQETRILQSRDKITKRLNKVRTITIDLYLRIQSSFPPITINENNDLIVQYIYIVSTYN